MVNDVSVVIPTEAIDDNKILTSNIRMATVICHRQLKRSSKAASVISVHVLLQKKKNENIIKLVHATEVLAAAF